MNQDLNWGYANQDLNCSCGTELDVMQHLLYSFVCWNKYYAHWLEISQPTAILHRNAFG